MLKHLIIRNFAIIETLEVSFNKGLNIITGETGAGKSIIIEAINLALGSRADTTYIRTGCDKAYISVALEIEDPVLLDFLTSEGIDTEDNILILSREITTNGKSICKINNQMSTVSFLNKISKAFVDIHGQYDHQSLLNPENHYHFIDLYNGKDILPILNQLKDIYAVYEESQKKYQKLVNKKNQLTRKKDYLIFEHNEIKNAGLEIDEDITLQQQLTKLQNSEKIFQGLKTAYEALMDGTSPALDQVGKASQSISDISSYDPKLEEMKQTLNDTFYTLEDLSQSIRTYQESIDYSQQNIDQIQERLMVIDGLKRKYGSSIEEILNQLAKIESELDLIENVDDLIKEAQQENDIAFNNITDCSNQLTNERKKSAESLVEIINQELIDLNFKNASFQVNFNVNLNQDNDIQFSAQGIDQIEFLISTNKGESMKPLSKIASGGEISRIMLALKSIIGDYDQIPTMIFDEIDTGISGASASIVGNKLIEISKKHQILCITHLPQIAAKGDYHYKIQKNASELNTNTTVVSLSQTEAIEEIARLLGGEIITESAITNAKDLMNIKK